MNILQYKWLYNGRINPINLINPLVLFLIFLVLLLLNIRVILLLIAWTFTSWPEKWISTWSSENNSTHIPPCTLCTQGLQFLAILSGGSYSHETSTIELVDDNFAQLNPIAKIIGLFKLSQGGGEIVVKLWSYITFKGLDCWFYREKVGRRIVG